MRRRTVQPPPHVYKPHITYKLFAGTRPRTRAPSASTYCYYGRESVYISGNPRVDGHARDLHQLRHRSDAIFIEHEHEHDFTNAHDLHCNKLDYIDPNNYVKLYDYTKIYVEFYIANYIVKVYINMVTSRWCTPAATAIRGGAIIATFWAAIIAAITAVAAVTAVLVGTTAALALSSVGGGLKVRIRGPAQHLLVVIRIVILILPPVPAVLGFVSFAIADLTRDVYPWYQAGLFCRHADRRNKP
ncbi:hypothetical protein QYE76_054156 [Lolium multiflorum]|uniref:Uncharacterized protein n=1 Tax=Lolium multiflorum TaxID=4521 RepID=A0AAD8SXL0_LOLMU|nr:hypothetical protein QYE76_054156 [Lolium multiflorum]